MRKLLIALSAAVVVLTACQKEVSTENGNNPGGGTGGTGNTKLVRVGTRAGADTLTSDYSYNASDRLVSIVHSGTVSGAPVTFQQRYTRNTSNIITSVVLKSPLYLTAGLDADSLVSKVYYDAALSRYSYTVSNYSFQGVPMVDSTVYKYDAGTGKLASIISYYGDGTSFVQDTKTEFTYTGSNIATVKQYTDDGSGTNFVLDETYSYEYDSNVNPLQFTADAPVMGMQEHYSANNAVKVTQVTVDPPQTVTSNVAYTYDSNNRPTKAVETVGSNTTTATYYYQ